MVVRASFLVLGVISIFLLGFFGLSVFPQLQLKATPPTAGRTPYSAAAAHGRQLYVANGCVYCHSQQVRPEGFGADQARGWGKRASLPGDYVFDDPAQLGSSRTGPDLSDIASRKPKLDWHLQHLYQPRAVSKYSVMPPLPWLFEWKAKGAVAATDVKVALGDSLAPAGDKGKVLIASQDALDLVAYLMTLKLDSTAVQQMGDAGVQGR